MSWQAFILVSVVLVSFRMILTRALARIKRTSNSMLALNAVIMTVLCIVGLVYVAFHHIDPSALWKYLPWFVAGGLFFGLSNGFCLKLFSHVDSAVGTVISTAAVFFTILFAGIFLGERLTSMQWLGALLLIPAIVYVVLLDRSQRKFTLNSQALFIGLIYTLSAGIALTNEKYLLNHMNIATYVLFGWGFQAVMSWVIAASQPKSFKILRDKTLWWRVLAIGVLMAAVGLTFIEAQVKSNNVSLVTVISSFRLILIALMAGWFLKEYKFYFQKLYASAIAVAGVILMVWK